MSRIPLQSKKSIQAIVRGESLGGPGLPKAQSLLKSGQVLSVIVLERTWDAVDRTRRLIDACGDDRISAHHVDVRPLLRDVGDGEAAAA